MTINARMSIGRYNTLYTPFVLESIQACNLNCSFISSLSPAAILGALYRERNERKESERDREGRESARERKRLVRYFHRVYYKLDLLRKIGKNLLKAVRVAHVRGRVRANTNEETYT